MFSCQSVTLRHATTASSLNTNSGIACPIDVDKLQQRQKVASTCAHLIIDCRFYLIGRTSRVFAITNSSKPMAHSAPLHVINLITNFPPHLDNKKINLISFFPCFSIRAAVHAQWGESFYKISVYCLQISAFVIGLFANSVSTTFSCLDGFSYVIRGSAAVA